MADRFPEATISDTPTCDLREPSGRYTAVKRDARIALMLTVVLRTACILGVSLKVAFLPMGAVGG